MIYMVVLGGFALFFATMAVGVMFGRKPLAGSCGGLAQVGLDGECKVCGKTPGSCDTDTAATGQIDAIDAMASKNAPDAMQKLRDDLGKNRGFSDPLDF